MPSYEVINPLTQLPILSALDITVKSFNMKLNREQAIKIAGIKNVEKVESRSCVPTSRLIYPSFEPEHEGMQEFTASIRFNEGNTLTAYYYQTDEDIEENQEDLSMLDWNIDHYEID